MLREEEGSGESSLVTPATSGANLPGRQDLPSKQQVTCQHSSHGRNQLIVMELAPLLGPIKEVPRLVLIKWRPELALRLRPCSSSWWGKGHPTLVPTLHPMGTRAEPEAP